MNIKKFFLDRLTFENLDKTLDKLDRGFTQFSKGMDSFNKGMEDFSRELSDDNKRHNHNSAKREKINKENLKKIWGNKKDSLF